MYISTDFCGQRFLLMKVPSRKNIIGAAAALVFAALITEASCRLFFTHFQERFSFYDINKLLLPESKFERAKRAYDRELGWAVRFDTPFGERPRRRSYNNPLLATFGDSYTFCDQVASNQTYQTYLSHALKADVFNFGQGGFGTDQAYLRFLRDYPKVKTPLVSLGLITENINRIVNVFRPYYYQKTALAMVKPRFILKDGVLTLIPNPIQSAEDIPRLHDVDFVLGLKKYDWWFNRDSQPMLAFPYSRILFSKRLWLEAIHARESSGIDDIDPRPWENLWEQQEAKMLLFAIMDSFVKEARSMGATPLIFLSPRKREVHQKIAGKEPEAAAILLAFCRERGYVCFDGISAVAAAARSPEDVRSLFNGHLTPLGNKVFAKALAAFLIDHNLAADPKRHN